ncbi:hypothetical protein GCM10010339_52140 [Streptomyces alanosinicus]|uniref:Uncharacterized protein n=1 Tax=Streptomyces alanosinicus TaxID=68171 RepID=A0A918YLV2_9ACTN|nr:hypothetical protein [Streptomyces alanosinicus]GHE07359.1 hypothetical protein GCM10010339_52140 [Streptomyces alanosinicus]
MSGSEREPADGGLDRGDGRDFADVDRGFVGRLEPGVVRGA